MYKQTIISTCEKHKHQFSEILNKENFQPRGIFNSEALLVCALTKDTGTNLLVESGRARGHSTNLFAKFFQSSPDFRIVSIDFDEGSKDTKYSEEYLSKYNNIELIYGNSFEKLPAQITEPCCVFIDGPKGDDALLLAASLATNPLIHYIFIHDLHQNTFHRNLCENIFTDTFFSDDSDFVDIFKNLDNNCWEVLADHDEKPHYRKGKAIKSYASTMAVIKASNNSINQDFLENYTDYYNHLNRISFAHYLHSLLPHNSPIEKVALWIYKHILKS